MLYRLGVRDATGHMLKAERNTVDFLVNGISLFSATRAGSHDMCGCFSSDYEACNNARKRHENKRIANIFTFETPAEIHPNRVALFICPECGDFACGAITFQLSRDGNSVLWSRFAYENGYDETQTDFDSYATIGPFEFAFDRYRAAIEKASHSRPVAR